MPPQTQRKPQGGAPQATPAAMVPFTAAAHEHTEIAFDETVQPGTNAQQLGPFDIPAYGYFRNLLIEVTTSTEGELEAEPVQNPDFPWNLFSNIQVNDVNGAPIFGPIDGFGALWSSISGGYAGRPDPRVMPFYSSETKKPRFLLRIPIEISHFDGFGSLANQNAAASYKVYLTLNTAANLSTKIKSGKAPVVRVRGYLEAWSLPNATDTIGRPQAQAPPMLDSAQYYSYFTTQTQKNQNTIRLTRVGSLIRGLVVIARKENGERADAVFPDPVTLEWDSRQMREDSQNMAVEALASSVPELKTRDAGVFAYLFDRNVKKTVGDDTPAMWLPTVQSTRLEIKGSSEEAGTWQIITNDIAPVAVAPHERYELESRTGFHPEFAGLPAPA